MALDRQYNPLDPHRSGGPWPPVQPLGSTQEWWPLTASTAPWIHRSDDPWLPVQPLGSTQEWWPLTASTAPWIHTGVMTHDPQYSPLDPHRSDDPWPPVQPLGSTQEWRPLTANAASWTHIIAKSITTPSIAFRHLPLNTARIGFATEGALFNKTGSNIASKHARRHRRVRQT